MITIEQCRAARGMLDWTQQELAGKAGLSKTAINNFEKGYSDIKLESLNAIRGAFEEAGVQFIDTVGITRRMETAKILRGESAFGELIKDIEATGCEEIMICYIDGGSTDHAGSIKMLDFLRRFKLRNIRIRLLTNEGVLTDIIDMRILRSEAVKLGVLTFIYAGKSAFALWGRSVIIIVDSLETAEAGRRHFEYLWTTAEPPALKKEARRQ